MVDAERAVGWGGWFEEESQCEKGIRIVGGISVVSLYCRSSSCSGVC